MSNEGTMARLGFVMTGEDEVTLDREFEVAEDTIVDGDLIIGGDVTVTGDVRVGGEVTSEGPSSYFLSAIIEELDTVNERCYVIVPQGGDGYLRRVRTVLLGDTGANGATLGITIDGTELAATYDVTIGAASSKGDVDYSALIPAEVGVVTAGDYIKLNVDSGSSNDVDVAVTFEIVRT